MGRWVKSIRTECPRCGRVEFVVDQGWEHMTCFCGHSAKFEEFARQPVFDDNDRTSNLYARMDNVNHPEHYAGTIECIDAMEACANPEQFIGYCRLCAFKYLWRAGKKGDAVTDYKKAIWYLERLVKTMEAR